MQNRRFQNFSEFRDHVLSLYLDFNPTFAATLGLHQYDGLIEDFSATRREAYVKAMRSAKETLELEFSGSAPDRITRFELRALEWKINDEIFRHTELNEYKWNPMMYADQLEISMLLDREFAPIEDRLRSVLARLRGYSRILAIARQNLDTDLDRTIVETALAGLEGRRGYLDEMAERFFGKIADATLLQDLQEASQDAKLAITSFIDAIRTVVLPNAKYDSFRLGPDLMRKYLRSAELVEEPLDLLLEKGKREMDRLTVELFKTSARLDPSGSPHAVFHKFIEADHFAEHEVIRETDAMLERIRSFIKDHQLVDIPSEVRCRVTETPSHMRWAFAAMNSPGAFERVATEAFYYVTLPEATWEAAKKEQYLQGLNRCVLEIISIHEAYPGHYTHFLHLQNLPTKVGKCFWSYAFLEGWAHYTEEMMVECGWGEGDPKVYMAYLQEALIRLCRYCASIELHTGRSTLAEVQHMFEEKALLTPVAARKEAERAVFDPGYLFYTLGKFQIRELRSRLERQPGFSLLQFHNELLSYGTAPVRIIGEMMTE